MDKSLREFKCQNWPPNSLPQKKNPTAVMAVLAASSCCSKTQVPFEISPKITGSEKFKKYQLPCQQIKIRDKMSKGQIITFLLILTIAFPAIIDPVPANLGNASNSSPTTGSQATPSSGNADYNNMSLDDLSKMINQMLAQLNQTVEDHSSLVNTTDNQPASSNSNLPETAGVQSNDFSNGQPNAPSGPSAIQPPTEQVQQSPDNVKPDVQQIKAPLQPSAVEPVPPKTDPVPPKTDPAPQAKPEVQSPPVPNLQTQAAKVQDPSQQSIPEPSSSGGQDNNASTDVKSTVDQLLNGNYFTYFVDLNAEKTGNIFLNGPDNGKTDQSSASKPAANTTETKPAANTIETKAAVKPTEAAPGKTLSMNSSMNSMPKPVKTQQQVQATPTGDKPITISSKSSKISGEVVPQKPADPATEQAPAIISNSKPADNITSSPPLPVSDSSKLASNAVSLCHTNDDCLMDYIYYIHMGLDVVCNLGVCEPHF